MGTRVAASDAPPPDNSFPSAEHVLTASVQGTKGGDRCTGGVGGAFQVGAPDSVVGESGGRRGRGAGEGGKPWPCRERGLGRSGAGTQWRALKFSAEA